MKANVFSEASADGGVRVYCPVYEVEAEGFDMKDACRKFVAALRAKYPWGKITLTEAEKEVSHGGR